MAIRSKCAASAPEHNPTPSGMPTEILPQSSKKRRRHRMRVILRRQLRALALAGAAAMVVVGSTGCSLFSNAAKQIRKAEYLDDFMIDHRNKVFAARAWYRFEDCAGKNRYPAEFKSGFIQGYIDVANGSNGCIPCVAPNQYWGWKYQSPGGQAAIDSWFGGYPLGVKAAEQDGVGYWSQMRTMAPAVPSPDDEKSQPEPKQDPAPMNTELILGPDGNPVTGEGEIIVPGSARVIETKQVPIELNPSLEMLAPPAPGITDPIPGNLPGLQDEALLEVGDGSVFASSQAAPVQVEQETLADAATLVPRQTGQTYSLNDLGDDAIEGIFGSMDAPSNLGAMAPSSTASQATSESLQGVDDVMETASANDEDIPFKFE